MYMYVHVRMTCVGSIQSHSKNKKQKIKLDVTPNSFQQYYADMNTSTCIASKLKSAFQTIVKSNCMIALVCSVHMLCA